jgi:Xaa-Pro aminopeptidase
MFDPLNIRYATDSTNMQVWAMHNPYRACLVLEDGYMVLWDYKNAPFLSSFNPLVREVRGSAALFYSVVGTRAADLARSFAAEVSGLVASHAGGNRRLGVDKIMAEGLWALEAAGFTITEGERVTEHARAVKGPDEIRAMRCAIAAAEAAIAEMESALRPGLSENELWSVLHAGNIRRGGEWIETRLLASGQRTNPWFQECGPRVIGNGEIVAFDTDLIGCYGFCCDISRTWIAGSRAPSPEMIADYRLAREVLGHNMALLRPGASIRELVFGGFTLGAVYQRQRYSCQMHGVGLCDEWPYVDFPEAWVEGSFEAVLEPGMTLCVEALISRENGAFSIKLEDQVLITDTGVENLTSYRWDKRLSG